MLIGIIRKSLQAPADCQSDHSTRIWGLWVRNHSRYCAQRKNVPSNSK